MHRYETTGDYAPGKFGGHKRSALIGFEDKVRELLAEQPYVTVTELWRKLTAFGIKVGRSAVGRFLQRLQLTDPVAIISSAFMRPATKTPKLTAGLTWQPEIDPCRRPQPSCSSRRIQERVTRVCAIAAVAPRPAWAPDREPCHIALLDRGHRLAGHPSEGTNFSFQGERIGREAPVLQSVPVALRSAASGPMHPADAMSPNGWRTAPQPAPLRFGVASQR
jgi:hypothetical protein